METGLEPLERNDEEAKKKASSKEMGSAKASIAQTIVY